MQALELDVADVQDAPALDLGVEELDENIAPDFWDYVAGIGAGAVLGGGALYLGIIAAT